VVEDSSWSETAITYNNRPSLAAATIGSLTDTLGSTSYDIVLDAAAVQSKAGGLLALGMDTAGSDGLVLYSRETSSPPELIVSYK
jgi:hypothetical protein